MKPVVNFEEFEKLDIRVGKVLEVQAPEWSYKLLELKVDFGEEVGTKTILSGIRKWYKREDLINKKFMFIVNLAERQMGEGVSQGMMLMALESEKPVLVEVPEQTQEGTVVG